MRYFLHSLNFAFIFVLAVVCMLFQSTLLHQGFGIFKPNLILIIVTYLALNRFAIEGGIVAYFLGYLVELNSGAPSGLFPAVMVLTFYTAKLCSEGLFINTGLSQMALVAVVSIMSKVFLVLVTFIYAPVGSLMQQIIVSVFPMAALNFLLTPIIFFLMKQMDRLLGKERSSKTGTQEPEIELYT